MRRLVARAPTRIDFGGGWTDVPPYPSAHGGFVCNVAITRYATATVTPGIDDRSVPLATAALQRARLADVRVELNNDFPVGAGLGGSSAAGVTLAGALAAWRGESLPRVDLSALPLPAREKIRSTSFSAKPTPAVLSTRPRMRAVFVGAFRRAFPFSPYPVQSNGLST